MGCSEASETHCKTPTERKSVELEMSSQLTASDLPLQAPFDVVILSKEPTTAADVTFGTVTLNTSGDGLLVLVTGGDNLADYELQAFADTAAGGREELTGTLQVRA